MKAFISYSHRDTNHLERLSVHLANMRREQIISEWTDREIHAGGHLDHEISEALASCQLFLALVSPDYIASNYCFEREFETAQQMQKAGKLTIVPIIIEACDWQVSPFGKFKALPTDGNPVAEWASKNTAYLKIVSELRKLITSVGKTLPDSNASSVPTTPNDSMAARNYKIKKNFSAVDKHDYREESFKKIAEYFQSAIREIDSIDGLQARFINIKKSSFSCLLSNRANNQDVYITLQLSSSSTHSFADLSYSFTPEANSSSIHMDDAFSIANDEYDLFWQKSMPGFFQQRQAGTSFTAREVAEHIWEHFISQVGVS